MVSSEQNQLEATSLELRPVSLLAAPQPLRRSVSPPTCNPQQNTQKALKRTVRSLFIVPNEPLKISLLSSELALMQLKDILDENPLIIFIFIFSDRSQVFQPYTFRTRRNSATVMSRNSLVSIEVSILSGFDWRKHFQM